MARVVLCGLDRKAGIQLAGLLAFEGHQVRCERYRVAVRDLRDADIVLMGGVPGQYLPLLRRLRGIEKHLPVVVIAPAPDISEWLDALEAGATDYCVPPFDTRQVRCLLAPRKAKLALAATA